MYKATVAQRSFRAEVRGGGGTENAVRGVGLLLPTSPRAGSKETMLQA